MKRRPDGRYQLKVNLGKDDNGKTVYKTVYGSSQKEVREKADELRTAIGNGLSSSEIDSTVEKWVKMFLASEKHRLTDSEYKTKKYRLDAFVNYIGKESKIKDIKPYNIEKFLTDMAEKNPYTGKKSSSKTLNEYKLVIGQMFRFAQINSAVTVNPCSLTREVKGEKKVERKALTRKEQEQIINLPDTLQPAKTMAMLGMLAGLRRGEIAALQWNDIDFKNCMIRVTKSYNYKTKTLKLPKTENGIRIVPLVDTLAEYLKKLKKQAPYVCGYLLKQYEWETERAKIILEMDKAVEPELKTMRLSDRCNYLVSREYFTWHSLRHTFATTMYDADVPVKAAQKFLGHAQVSTTMDIYTHLSAEKEAEAMALIKNFGGQMGVKQNAKPLKNKESL